MKIVLLSHYFPPEVNAPASRTFEHCREWAKAGHHVTVVTCAPNHPFGKLYDGYKNKIYSWETVDGVHVLRVWTLLAANRGFLLRTLNYVSFLFSVSFSIWRLSRPDVVISTSPQFFCGLTGYIARVIWGVPWVLEIRDLWPESIVTVGAMRKGLVIKILEGLESFAYRKADHIVSVTDSFVSHIASRCRDTSKISVIKNGVDLRHFRQEWSAADAKQALGLQGKFVAAYVGTHGMAHGLDMILDAAKITASDPGIVYLMVGDGAEKERLVARAMEMRLQNVIFFGQRPKSDMPKIWAATDVSLILLRPMDTFRKVLPSKMFEAMARPIVLGVEGEAKGLLTAAGAGVAVTPGEAPELAAAVQRLEADPKQAQCYGASGAHYVRENFDRMQLAADFLEVLIRVCRRKTAKV